MIGDKNLTQLLIPALQQLALDNPEYSFGEILYAFTRPKNLLGSDGKISTLRDIKDTDYYTAIEKALKSEKR